jgi:predicted nucleotidyltransferase
VKGLIHPPNSIIAFPRYFPDEKGERRRKGMSFSKVYSLAERYALLKTKYPQYLVLDPVFDETLCKVPLAKIKKHHDPVKGLEKLRHSKHLDPLQNKAVQAMQLLKREAAIPWDKMGISGSILISLHTSKSDIDPIVYGLENCRKTYSALKTLLKDEDSPFKVYSREELKTLFDFRSKDNAGTFEDFVRTESRKAMQGKFMGTDYFMRFVKDWNEIDEEYGDFQYRNMGNATIRATIINDSEAILTPCKYRVENVTIIEGSNQPTEILSFRGRFCEQARKNEAVAAQGKLECVTDRQRKNTYYRLLIGNKPSDYMIING